MFLFKNDLEMSHLGGVLSLTSYLELTSPAFSFLSVFRIKIEEEYAKNLSKLSQIPLAAQEEG